MVSSMPRAIRYLILVTLSVITFCVLAAETQRAMVIRTATLKSSPSFGAGTVTVLAVGQAVELGQRVGGWQKVTILPEATRGGWLRSYQVRAGIDASPSVVKSHSSNRGVLSGLSSLSRGTASLFGQRELEGDSGNLTATVGVRGLTEADLENARPDSAELQVLKSYSVNAQSAQQFAQAGGLQSQAVRELPQPKKEKKSKKKDREQGGKS
jgi:hypothetical protein